MAHPVLAQIRKVMTSVGQVGATLDDAMPQTAIANGMVHARAAHLLTPFHR